MLAAWFVVVTGMTVPSPGAIPLHYRLELEGSLTFDGRTADTIGRNGAATAIVYLTATVRDTVGGYVARVVIDSASCHGEGVLSMAFDSSVARRSRGAWFDVPLLGARRDVVPEASIHNPLTGRVALVLGTLFAPVHPPYAKGVTFSDTIDILASSDRWEQRSPTVTRWKVADHDAAHTILDGEVIGLVTVTGRVTASGLLVGHRTATLSPGDVVEEATISTSQQTLLVPQDNTEIFRAIGTVSATVTLLPPHP